MKIVLSTDDRQLLLPVAPPNFGFKLAVEVDTVSVMTLGELAIPGKKKLQTTAIKSFFPGQLYPFAHYNEEGFKLPEIYVASIEEFIRDGQAVLLEAEGFKAIKMYITNFEHSVKDGSGDVYYNLSFVEAVEHQLTAVSSTGTALVPNRSEQVPKSIEVVVKSGDTLSQLAKKYTGKSENWRKIAKDNNISNPRLLQIGTKLVIR